MDHESDENTWRERAETLLPDQRLCSDPSDYQDGLLVRTQRQRSIQKVLSFVFAHLMLVIVS